jgi:ubiquinone/menaquinone biosynthesis C-methylase UbiE
MMTLEPETSGDTGRTQQRAGWYKHLFASMMAVEQETRRDDYDAHKRVLLGDLHGDVLEIGPGTGPNLAYYPRDVRWTGLEPNPAMFRYIEQEAEKLNMTIQLQKGRAEQINAPDASFDVVVSTLVLCSVKDPQQTLREIRRVLKSGGRYVFIEHVAAPRRSVLRRVQQFIKPLWMLLGDGCHPDRETWAAIENAGFSDVQIEHFRQPIPVASPHIAGIAVK